MLILLSPAKTMRERGEFPKIAAEFSALYSLPIFESEAQYLCEQISMTDTPTLAKQLKINSKLAELAHQRYQQMLRGESEQSPAIFSYNGIVFKNIGVEKMCEQDIIYSNDHILFTSFLYGLLRPLDLISPYRLEGDFKLNKEQNIFSFWRDKLTDVLIDRVNNSGGVLCNLASGEMKQLFDWKKVCESVKVVSPEFKTGGKTIVVHTKMARGLMTRYIIENKISTPDELEDFSLGGYCFGDGVFNK